MQNHHKPAVISAAFKRDLESELQHLCDDQRPLLAERLKSAREGGDATDNSAFEQAKEELARLMARIADIEQTLREATILHRNGNGTSESIELGSTVTVARDDGRTQTFTIVCSLEASTRDGKISDESPIGRALVGHRRGDTVSVQAPAKTCVYKITEIQ
ncbi:MAG: transcription elongation factor GreA [Chloroflexota bacterium]